MGKTGQNGGPAFPSGIEMSDGTYWHEQGMTLRDWFAGQALVSMGDRRWNGDHYETGTQKQVRAAYRIADTMLAFRSEQNGDET